jgi:ABC-type phosphate/phosphonate transport system substrate-binding protein
VLTRAASPFPGEGAAQDAVRPIEIGIRPSLPTTVLLGSHQSLRRHFEKTFKRRVALSTTPDFRSFQRSVLRGDFDFIIIGPGPGWQAHLDRGYPIIAVASQQVRVYLLVAREGPIKSITDLRGATVATIGPLTVSAQEVVAILREHNLQPGIDVQISHQKNPFNVAQSVAQGEVAAAGFPNITYPSLPAEIRNKLRILHVADAIPGIFFMVRPAPDMPSPAEFQAALFAFAHDTEAGRAFIKENNHGGLLRPDLNALRVLDRFLSETRQAVSAP